MKYFDTHAHIIKEYYDSDERQLIFERAFKQGVEYILIPGTTPNDSKEILNYKSEKILIAAGIHPIEANSIEKLDFFKEFDFSKLSAIGEIGLDLHYESNPEISVQKEIFMLQLDIALSHNLPVIIHNRDTSDDVYKIMTMPKYRNIKFVLHSFGQTIKEAKMFIDLGAYISFSGTVTFKSAHDLRKALEAIPLDKIVIETDSPYLTPEPNRGKRNEPSYLPHVLKEVARVKKVDVMKMSEIIFENSKRLFNL